ncbi:MAG: hypothetical protein KC443_16935, partial [Anaerolineales bacterium]|nr:hypothetical protein [Anaerolineales bacterium]
FGGLFMMLAFFLFAIFQETRLQEIGREFLGGQHPGIVAWLRFTLPLLLVVAVAAITNNVFPNPFGASLALVDRAIHVARTYEGDLFALGLEQGENYAGISAVRDQLDGAYTLSFGAVDTATDTVIILAYFDSGVWIRCRLVNQQLSFCEDASRPYTIGLAHLLTGVPLPEDCQGCLPKVSDEWTAWLAEQQVHFQGEPTITRQAAEGSYILMRAESENGRYAVTCWFSGQPRVQIDRCATES